MFSVGEPLDVDNVDEPRYEDVSSQNYHSFMTYFLNFIPAGWTMAQKVCWMPSQTFWKLQNAVWYEKRGSSMY